MGLAISIEQIQTILGIIILVVQILWILWKLIYNIYVKIKSKRYSEIKDDIETAKHELEEIQNDVTKK